MKYLLAVSAALALSACAGSRQIASVLGPAMVRTAQARAYQQQQYAYPAIDPGTGMVNPQVPGQQYYYPQQVQIVPNAWASPQMPPSPATWHQ